MIDHERRNELQNALAVLTRHNLYRRGYCDMEAAEIDPAELGTAIDAAAGCILEYLRLEIIFHETARNRNALASDFAECQDKCRNAEKMIDHLADRIEQFKAENRRLKALLASHHIKYKA